MDARARACVRVRMYACERVRARPAVRLCVCLFRAASVSVSRASACLCPCLCGPAGRCACGGKADALLRWSAADVRGLAEPRCNPCLCSARMHTHARLHPYTRATRPPAHPCPAHPQSPARPTNPLGPQRGTAGPLQGPGRAGPGRGWERSAAAPYKAAEAGGGGGGGFRERVLQVTRMGVWGRDGGLSRSGRCGEWRRGGGDGGAGEQGIQGRLPFVSSFPLLRLAQHPPLLSPPSAPDPPPRRAAQTAAPSLADMHKRTRTKPANQPAEPGP